MAITFESRWRFISLSGDERVAGPPAGQPNTIEAKALVCTIRNLVTSVKHPRQAETLMKIEAVLA
jgi:hypothetical protein